MKNEDNVRKEDSLKWKTHTAPPLRPSVVLVMIYGTDIGKIYATFGAYMAYI